MKMLLIHEAFAGYPLFVDCYWVAARPVENDAPAVNLFRQAGGREISLI